MDQSQEDILESRKRFLKEYEKEFFLFHRGRMKRLDFLMLMMGASAIDRLGEYIETSVDIPYLAWVFYIFALYLRICILPKRLRDIGFSGLFAIPIMLLNALVVGFMFMGFEDPSTFTGDDQYLFASLMALAVLNLPLFFWPSQKRDNKFGVYHPWSLMGGYKAK